ncbi:MAG: tetratricopeptide repeat protein [Aureliella sp.]
MVFSPSQLRAENEGLEKLDEATTAKLGAENPRDLQKVIELCQEAIKEGLDEDNELLAKKMLAASAMQRAEVIWGQFNRLATNRATAMKLGEAVIKDLETATEANPKLPGAFLMLAEIQAKLKADIDSAMDNVSKAIDLLSDNPARLAAAYVLRARMQQDSAQKLRDFERAIEADPTSDEAWQSMIGFKIAQGKLQEAIEDAEKLLEKDADNQFAVDALFRSLVGLRKFDEALKLKSSQIEKAPDSPQFYMDRAGAYRTMSLDNELSEEEQLEARGKALADYSKSLELESQNALALVNRGQIYYEMNELDKAQRDIDESMAIAPTAMGLLLKTMVAGSQGRIKDAIVDMEKLVAAAPKNADWIWQLAQYYQIDNRPRKAIELLDVVLKMEPDFWRALRSRGDAKLSIGEHKAAIEDFERALKTMTADGFDDPTADTSGLLNNLAWVLATSPNDSVRDGKRAVELATRSCEETDFKAAHILSTLAAAYAETGDFEKAREWAKKAVAQGEEDADNPEQLEHLKQELESYEKNEKWRERQDEDQSDQPLDTPLETIDT